MTGMLAVLFAILAILTQPNPPPVDFVAGLTRAYPVTTPDFVGLQWQCDPADPQYAADPDDADYCYAGLSLTGSAAGLVTGP